MKKSVFIIALILSCASAFAQPGRQRVDTIKVWPNGAPNAFEAPAMNEQMRRFVGKSYTEAKLEVYPARNPNGLCIIMCPGGAYIMESQTYEGRDLHDWFNARGITYCMLEYRLPHGHHDVPLSDLAEAVRIMRSRAAEYGITKVAVMGNSAGGHLASSLAVHYDAETRPDFQILMYPVITMDASFTNTLSRDSLLGTDPSQELVDYYSNEKQVTADTPPAFIMLCSDDTAVPVANSIRYYEQLIANKVSATMHIYPFGGHGFGWQDSFRFKEQWVDELDEWLTTIVYPTL